MGSHDDAVLTEEFVDAVLQATSMFQASVDRSSLTGSLRIQDIPGWDSLNQITMMLQLERWAGLPQGTLRLRPEMKLSEVAEMILAHKSGCH